jgi:hypothetical protein
VSLRNFLNWQINNWIAATIIICFTAFANTIVNDATELAKYKLQLQILREYRQSGSDHQSPPSYQPYSQSLPGSEADHL